RRLNAAHGRTYFLATRLLPEWKRPYVHALYGFARYADEIVDEMDSSDTGPERAARLTDWSQRFLAAARGEAAPEADGSPAGDAVGDEVLPAVLDTIRRFDIPLVHFEAFLSSMAMDLTVTSYATFDDLLAYVHGSAAVIGLQMLPILEPSSSAA